MRLNRTLAETIEVPQRPTPKTLRIDIPVHREARELARRFGDLTRWAKQEKAYMVAKLAEALSKDLQLFSENDLMAARETISLELTLNDRGSYQNWLPHERSEGRNEGVKAERQRGERVTPYGMEPERYYE